MPARNIVKTYIKNAYYHIYNRGVEKRTIFTDEQDFRVFLSYLKESLSKPVDKLKIKKSFTLKGSTFKGVPRQPKNFHQKIELLAYCLMQNHFHFLVKQNDNRTIKSFMQALCTRYSIYFNKRHERVGSLFQGIYKAAMITQDPYILHLSRYIHLNPGEHTKDLVNTYSSYGEYLGVRKTEWIKPDFILKYFQNKTFPETEKFNSYKKFVEVYKKDSGEVLNKLTLED